MSTKQLSEVLSILKSADAIMVDNYGLSFPMFGDDIEDYPVMIVRWIEANGDETKCEFYAEDNTIVEFDGVSFYMVEEDSSVCEVTPLFSKNLGE